MRPAPGAPAFRTLLAFGRGAWGGIRRRGVLVAALGLLLAGHVHGQAKDELPQPTDVPLNVPGLTLQATYWGSNQGIEAGVVLLLHGRDGNRLDWPESFPLRLQKEGYAVLALDLRGHGQSRVGGENLVGEAPKGNPKNRPKGADLKPADYQAMAAVDLEAVKQFLFDEHMAQRLNMNRLAIIAPDFSAEVAMAYTALDWNKRPYQDAPTLQASTPRGQDVRGLVLVSPQEAIGLKNVDTVKFIRSPVFNIGVLVCVGNKDKLDKGHARKLYDQLLIPEKENKGRMYFDDYATAAHGIDMFGKNLRRRDSLLEDRVLAFLDLHVRQAPDSQWRDRRPRDKRLKDK